MNLAYMWNSFCNKESWEEQEGNVSTLLRQHADNKPGLIMSVGLSCRLYTQLEILLGVIVELPRGNLSGLLGSRNDNMEVFWSI